MKVNVIFSSDKEKSNLKKSLVIIAIFASFVCGCQIGYNGANHKIRILRKQYAARIQELQSSNEDLQNNWNNLNKVYRERIYKNINTNLEK